MTAAEHNPHLEVLDAELVHELAVTGRNPAAALDVLDAQLVEPAPYRSPLDPNPRTGQYPTVLRGGRLTDLTEVEHVRVRAAYRGCRGGSASPPPARPAIGSGGGDGRPHVPHRA